MQIIYLRRIFIVLHKKLNGWAYRLKQSTVELRVYTGNNFHLKLKSIQETDEFFLLDFTPLSPVKINTDMFVWNLYFGAQNVACNYQFLPDDTDSGFFTYYGKYLPTDVIKTAQNFVGSAGGENGAGFMGTYSTQILATQEH